MASAVPKRATDRVPPGGVSVWSLLVGAIQAADERPENSVTPEEFAARAGLQYAQASKLLRGNPALSQVPYRRNGRRAVCYVPRAAE